MVRAMTHDTLCPLTQPCGADTPRHGYCGFAYQRFCMHCNRECQCELIAKVRADEKGRENDESFADFRKELNNLASCASNHETRLRVIERTLRGTWRP